MSYEEQKRQNILKNREILASLGLGDGPFAAAPVPAAVTPKASPAIKRTKSQSGPKPKKPRTSLVSKADTESDASGLRRSLRTRGQRVSYVDDERSTPSKSAKASPVVKRKAEDDYEESDSSEEEGDDGDYSRTPQRKAQRLGIRTQDPKQFGHIPGVEVGTWWESRMDCSTAAIHAPTVCGIAGSEKDGGAYSIALSGGYEDDIDQGYVFTYTGAGGRDLKGTPGNRKNLRTAPQSKDQSFEHSYNKALQTSVKTKKPVRVVRGFKLDSKYAPKEGYRYDGLYVVEKAWMETGLNPGGYKVCKFALRRLTNQPPIPVNKSWRPKDGDDALEELENEAEHPEEPDDAESEAEDEEEVKPKIEEEPELKRKRSTRRNKENQKA